MPEQDQFSSSDKAFILELLKGLGKVEGRTKLQKIIFLGQKELGLPEFFKFDKYHYGPYSWDLTEAIEDLIAIGYIKEEKGYYRDFITYVYKLSYFALSKVEIPSRYIAKDKMQTLKKLSELPRSAIIEYVYRKYLPERLTA